MVKVASLTPLARKISRNAGARRSSMSAFQPPYAHTLEQQVQERVLAHSRSADLTAND